MATIGDNDRGETVMIFRQKIGVDDDPFSVKELLAKNDCYDVETSCSTILVKVSSAAEEEQQQQRGSSNITYVINTEALTDPDDGTYERSRISSIYEEHRDIKSGKTNRFKLFRRHLWKD